MVEPALWHVQPGTDLDFFSLGTSAASVNETHLAFEELSWRNTHTPKTDIVVTIVGIVVVAVRRADVFVQVDVGPELGGEVADGQAPGTERGEEIVAGQVDGRGLACLDARAAVQDLVNQPHHLLVGDAASE